MSLIRWSPMMNSLDDFDRMFEDFVPASRSLQAFVPSMDVYQDKENVIVETPLPGVNPENVSISIENDVLTVEGKSESKSEVDEKNYYRKEVRRGAFHRAVALPVAVNGDNAKATFEDGVLKIVIPKEERAKPKQVKVNVVKKKK